jgi:mRNA-degrading endonuclease YafQ of YafQ-DinJ toxin-antitoxin module
MNNIQTTRRFEKDYVSAAKRNYVMNLLKTTIEILEA